MFAYIFEGNEFIYFKATVKLNKVSKSMQSVLKV